MTHRRSPALVALALASVLAVTGCGDTSEPDLPEASGSPSQSPSGSPSGSPSSAGPSDDAGVSQVVDVSINGDEVLPQAQALELAVGEPLRLTIDADRAGELHVHSNPEQLPAFEEGQSSLELVFDKPGQVDVEEHESGVLILRILVQ